MQKKGYSCECLGGGRISHQSQDKKIHVYGYSMVSPQPGSGVERPALTSTPCPAPRRPAVLGVLWAVSAADPSLQWLAHFPRGVGGRPLPAPPATGGHVLFLHQAWLGHHCPPALGGSQLWGEAQKPLPLPFPSRSGYPVSLGTWDSPLAQGPPSRTAHLGSHLSSGELPGTIREGWPRVAPPGDPSPSQLLGFAADGRPEPGWGCKIGFSLQGYGRAQHSVSTEKIKAVYPDYEVTWADDGY